MGQELNENQKNRSTPPASVLLFDRRLGMVGVGLGQSRKKTEKTSSQERKIGKYVLGAQLGVGGFGVVRLATDTESGAVVAVKILDKAQLQLMNMSTQIKREITLLTTLKHPNIVNGVGILNSTAKLYLFMEYVEGGDMHTLLSEQKKLSEIPARRYFYGLISCLAYCHGKGVTHRDLKLENLLITKSSDLKVCDFGLASVRDQNSDLSQLCSTIVGTEDFAAPEILRQLPYRGEKADMWSAGIILYTIIAGYCPFRGHDTTALFAAIKNCRFSFPEDFPFGAKQVVNALLVSNPEKRASAEQVLECNWLQQFRIDDGKDDEDKFKIKLSSISSGIEETDQEIANVPSPGDEASDVYSLRAIIQKNPSLALAAQTIEGFPELYTAMRKDKSLVKDRRWRFRLFPSAFLGEDMVTWIAKSCKVSRLEAVAIGDRMLHAEVFHHVCRDHSFKDEFLFYRFAVDSPDSSVLNVRQLWPSIIGARHPLLVSMSVLNSLLALIKIHQAIISGSSSHAEVDVDSLREDEAFFSFRMAVAELQAVKLVYLHSKGQKVAFLLNILHIMVLHIRITDDTAFRNRSQFWAKTRLEYNIAGTRITVRDLTELLGIENVSESREYDGEGSNGSLLSPQAIRPSGILSSRPSSYMKQLGPLSPKGATPDSLNAKTLAKQPKFTSGFLHPLSRRQNSAKSSLMCVKTALRYEREKGEVLELFVNDGSSSCMPLQVYDEKGVAEAALRQRLSHFLIQKMKIDTKKCSLILPSTMWNYRTITGLFSDRQLILEIQLMLENAENSAKEGEDEAQRRIDTIESIKILLKSKVPLHVAIAEPQEEYFAPEIHVLHFDVAEDS